MEGSVVLGTRLGKKRTIKLNYPKIDLSIVVPLHNEEDCVRPLHQAIKQACSQLPFVSELIYVDDGSTDNTYAILAELFREDPGIRVVKFRKNYGQTAAMQAGFRLAKGKVVMSMDGDLQNDPKDIPRLIAKLGEGYDVVCGWRKDRKDKFWSRRLPSVVANWIIGRITGVKIHDNGCSLKAYRSSVIKKISLYGEMHRFIPAMSTLADARIAEIEVSHHPRRFGQSKYGIGRVWRVILDIVLVKMLTGFVSRPSLWFGILSFPFVLLGGTIFIAAMLFLNEQRIDYWIVTSTVSLLFLFLGGNLVAMGIIGELSMKTGDYSPKENVNSTIILE